VGNKTNKAPNAAANASTPIFWFKSLNKVLNPKKAQNEMSNIPNRVVRLTPPIRLDLDLNAIQISPFILISRNKN
jgi:hypothetical protein